MMELFSMEKSIIFIKSPALGWISHEATATI
jgi:hypothetical protein